ncbi:hypothetical protein BIW11_05897 [Tropilaelaps mercedesae]|uniref:Uncharacterized protein n=1 Tax=Tropilaelaps mercedesae TaxID=418985 RepID=A0A1V9Y0J4_9ACAR|nr:hypothetical protein BIW11_05897 [Tropilaelaps mercedesae]
MFRLSGNNDNNFNNSAPHEVLPHVLVSAELQKAKLMSLNQQRNTFTSFKAGVSSIPGSADSGASGFMETSVGQPTHEAPVLNVLGPVLKHGSIDKFPDPSDQLLLSGSISIGK